MQIELDASGEGGQRCLVLTHDLGRLEWNIAFAQGLRNLRPVVRDINGYWAKMSNTRQTQIFKQFEKIHSLLENTANELRLDQQLRPEMEQLFQMHPYTEAEEYVRRFGTVKYPRDLKDDYGIGAPATALTYLRVDYTGLLVLTLLMRVALPVLGAYIARFKDIAGTNYKELKAISIMAMTHVVMSPSYAKLKAYIDTYISDTDTPLSAVLDGLGSEIMPDWLLAQALIRRIAISELVYVDEPEEPQNLVRSIYNYIRNVVDSPDKRHGGPVREKVPDNRDGHPDDNMSRADTIKVKQPVSEGNLVVYSVYVEQYHRMAERIDPTITRKFTDACLIKLRSDNSFSVDSAQIALVQYCLNSVVPARSIPHLEYDALVCAVAVCQALLLHWGFPDLAALVTAKRSAIPTTTMVGSVRNKLTKEQISALVALYPHHQMQVGKHVRPVFDGSMSQELIEQANIANNVGILAINELSRQFADSAWVLKLPEEFTTTPLTMTRSDYGWLVPATIKNQLADLILRIAKL